MVVRKVLALLLVLMLSGCVSSQQTSTRTELEIVDKGLEVIISPTNNTKVGGIISVDIKSVPDNAKKILVMLSPYNFVQTDSSKTPFEYPDVAGSFLEGNVQEYLIDTTTVSNGLYNLAVMVQGEQVSETPWIAGGQVQVIVEN